MSKERQLRKQEEIKNTILDIARDIISKEGLQALSIRKITNTIDYSPAIIYHYFKDKNEIIESLVDESYSKILNSIKEIERNDKEPEKEIKESFIKYINAALASPEEYKIFALNGDPRILKRAGVLERGISKRNETFKRLCENIQRGIDSGQYQESLDIELTAQIIWTATFGLIIRLIVEKDISKEQFDRLIEHHFTILFSGILKKERGIL